MSAGAIGGATAANNDPVNRFAELQSSEFINVMLAELANQDPFEPSDSSAILEQLSSLRNIESQLKLQEKLETLVLQNQITSAGGMLGKLVSGLTDTNDQSTGVVTSVRVNEGRVLLELDSGQTLPLDRVAQIDNPVT
jgi:flagellar basal-body rod modification protein FlgD